MISQCEDNDKDDQGQEADHFDEMTKNQTEDIIMVISDEGVVEVNLEDEIQNVDHHRNHT